ncbi:MAG TPA: hypothetical protein VHK22_05345 [Gaiellaceae bacterium]|jgi:hypothetical protein|nr:hypothetical protein [Gaiellaceae bacterium]
MVEAVGPGGIGAAAEVPCGKAEELIGARHDSAAAEQAHTGFMPWYGQARAHAASAASAEARR